MTEVFVTVSKLLNLASNVINVVLDKNADYGDAWQHNAPVGVLVRLSDKLCRLETLADGRNALVQNETIVDTLMDVVGYGLLALLWYSEKSRKDA